MHHVMNLQPGNIFIAIAESFFPGTIDIEKGTIERDNLNQIIGIFEQVEIMELSFSLFALIFLGLQIPGSDQRGHRPTEQKGKNITFERKNVTSQDLLLQS